MGLSETAETAETAEMVVPVVVGVLGVPAVWVAAVLRRGFPVMGVWPVPVGLVAVVGMGVTVLRPRV
ncbi:MAG: hypothetical protein R2763_13340 [Mycobacterium sp.]